jgi:hypothetical protein
MVLRVVRSNAQPYRYNLTPAGELGVNMDAETTRYWNRYTPEEQARLQALAYAWRVNLQYSMAEAGCSSLDEYLELYR